MRLVRVGFFAWFAMYTGQPGLGRAQTENNQPAAHAYALAVGRVVGVTASNDTIDVELLQGGRVRNVPMAQGLAGRHFGMAGLPLIDIAKDAATETGGNDVYALIGYQDARAELPYCIGFLPPKRHDLLKRPEGSRVVRDSGKQIEVAWADGNYTQAWPGGGVGSKTASTLDAAIKPPVNPAATTQVWNDAGVSLALLPNGSATLTLGTGGDLTVGTTGMLQHTVTIASASVLGHVKVGQTLTINNATGVLDVRGLDIYTGQTLTVYVGGTAIVGMGNINTLGYFTGNVYTMAGTSLYWDTTNKWLGLSIIAPRADVHIQRNASGALGPVLRLSNFAGGAGAGAAIDFDGFDPTTANSASARIQSVDDGSSSAALVFLTRAPGASSNALAERMRISSAGVMSLTQALPIASGGHGAAVPAFSVSKSAGAHQTGLASGQFTQVQFQTEAYDTYNAFATHAFTVPVAGQYVFTGTVLFSSMEDQKTMLLSLYKNGARFRDQRVISSGAAAQSVSILFTVQATVGTTFSIYMYHDCATAKDLYGGVSECNWSGVWLGP